jgi:DNA primase large subunit
VGLIKGDKMKFSSRKQLLSEAEQELKGIKRSINEASVPQREVEKVTSWMESAIPFVVEDRVKEKYSNFVEDFFRYLEIPTASPKDAKGFKNNAEYAITPVNIIISNFKEQLRELKKLEAKLPEIEKIVRAVESDIKKMK